MKELRERGYWQYFLFGWMFSLFGGIALVLAAIGVYGVLSYSVAQRTQEIGVRMALGAGRGDVLKLVVVQGVRLAIVGVVIGVVGSFFVTPMIKSELVNVSPTDPLSFIGVSHLPHGRRVHRQLRARPPGDGCRSAGRAARGIGPV